MMHGLIHLPWWGYILVALFLTQITIFCVTIYLHRCMAHRALELHPIASHFFRFWLWLTTGMVTLHWTAIHRKHHAKVETEDDPHSPQVKGIWKVLLEGAELYRKESRNQETLDRYGEGTPNDWIENHVYQPHSAMGIAIMFIVDVLLFGPIGITIWAVQMAWIPFWAAGIVNGVGHYVGYRNFECEDASRNIIPIGFIIGGEELHNNHHTYGTSAKFSVKWWEFDIGWMIICFLKFLGLANPKRVPPRPQLMHHKQTIDIDTLKGIFTHRFQLMADYSRNVIIPVLREERRRVGAAGQAVVRRARTLLIREQSLVDARGKKQLELAFALSHPLQMVYQHRLALQNLWAKSTASQHELLEALQEWCRQAELTGIKALKDFVRHVKKYVPI